ncbi:MAG: hypothetical protein AAB610_00040 [Patescibacteria group bacterium]
MRDLTGSTLHHLTMVILDEKRKKREAEEIQKKRNHQTDQPKEKKSEK